MNMLIKPVLFICTCFLTLCAFCQDECKLIKDSDPYTKEVKLSSGFISLQGGSVTIDADSKEIDFFFVIDDKCFDNLSTVSIFLEGSKVKTTYSNAGNMNCTGYFHFKYRNSATTPTQMNKMATQKISQLIFKGTDKKETVISLLPAQQEMLMKAVACMAAEAPKLVK
jgi:hypothetical protein